MTSTETETPRPGLVAVKERYWVPWSWGTRSGHAEAAAASRSSATVVPAAGSGAVTTPVRPRSSSRVPGDSPGPKRKHRPWTPAGLPAAAGWCDSPTRTSYRPPGSTETAPKVCRRT
ncbi:hypothetical protein GCM10009814_39920 [Lapillicoccus jejuensis]